MTVSDLSEKALELCRRFDGRLKTRALNAEDMSEVEDGSYDLVFVRTACTTCHAPFWDLRKCCV